MRGICGKVYADPARPVDPALIQEEACDRLRIEKEFSMERTVEEYIGLYERLMKKSEG